MRMIFLLSYINAFIVLYLSNYGIRRKSIKDVTTKAQSIELACVFEESTSRSGKSMGTQTRK